MLGHTLFPGSLSTPKILMLCMLLLQAMSGQTIKIGECIKHQMEESPGKKSSMSTKKQVPSTSLWTLRILTLFMLQRGREGEKNGMTPGVSPIILEAESTKQQMAVKTGRR